MSYDGDPALVITPSLWSGAAIQLSNRQWKKRILPVGDVQYQGRTLHFTRDYLGKLVDAFRSNAYDQVSFQLADSKNSHTNDPERHRGTITDLQLSDDGLWATAQVTEAGERVLAENPMLGVSARIVENYARSDGQFYPAAIQHVLGTLDPRIPQLGAWSPVEMSNGGGITIDLSGGSWAGEPGPAFDVVWNAVASRIGSRDQVPAGNLNGYDDIDAVIAASLPQDYGYAELGEFDRQFQLSNETELARLEQDAELPAQRTEDRIATALDRISQGTFTPRAWDFASPGYGTVTGEQTCGTADDLGYCMERYHAPGCGSHAGPDITENLRPQLERIALQPHLGEDGQPWIDAKYGTAMTLTDKIEALTGQRLGDGSLWESHRGQRRELAAAQRPYVHGDPDAPGTGQLFPASTVATVRALAAQAGISTSADADAQRAAAVREISRQAAKYRVPRHPDYAEFSNPVHEDRGLAEFGPGPLFGSLQVYSRAGAA